MWRVSACAVLCHGLRSISTISSDFHPEAVQAVASSAGIGLLPTFVAERGGGARLERVLPRHSAPGAALHLVYPSARYMPQRMSAFRDFVLEQTTSGRGRNVS